VVGRSDVIESLIRRERLMSLNVVVGMTIEQMMAGGLTQLYYIYACSCGQKCEQSGGPDRQVSRRSHRSWLLLWSRWSRSSCKCVFCVAHSFT
jgi:hypothetical protein